jgi:tyrosyl-tRNA synthetase
VDVETKIALIKRPPTEEVVTESDLRSLLEVEEKPIAYNGWEPSGLVHLGTGLICAYKMRDLLEAGVRFKAYLACYHAFINRKLGGDIDLIKTAALHFRHAWIACGVPADKIEFIWPEKEYDNLEYWTKVLTIARRLTVSRVKRTLEIMGRKEVEARYVADFIYTPMQVADIFHFDVKICQLGMDQRKANMVARELGEKLGYWKPVCVHHHLLQGLSTPMIWPLPDDLEARREAIMSAKMSKSDPKTCIWIYDQPNEIRKKILAAFCPERIVEFNPVMDVVKHIIFREKETLTIERPIEYGGKMEFSSYEELKRAYEKGVVHPLDLKNAVADSLVEVLEPIRRYFSQNSEAHKTLEVMRKVPVTR